MAESTLAAPLTRLQADLGYELGYGRGEEYGLGAWTAKQQQDIDRFTQGGLRRFYHCGVDWTFLKPVITVALASGQYLAPVPDDVGGMEGNMILSSPEGLTWQEVQFRGMGEILARSARLPDQTGPPEVATMETIKGTTATASSRMRIRVYPTADQAYSLQFRCYINPNCLDGTHPYAYGGPQHAQTLLMACLAEAELLADKIMDGPLSQSFEKQLAISKKLDERSRPQKLGYCGDTSDSQPRQWWSRHNQENNPVSFYGVPTT